MNFLENQKWRYATKKYDSSKKISEADLNYLKESMRLSASSYGLQLYKIIIVENPELRKKLQSVSYNQMQVIDASHLIVFANQTKVSIVDVANYVENVSKTRLVPLNSLDGLKNYYNEGIAKIPEDSKNTWTAKQTYIILANLLAAAAELKIDATPMEGFHSQEYNEILGLGKMNLNAAVVATIGYRHPDDATQHNKKVRKSMDDLFIIY